MNRTYQHNALGNSVSDWKAGHTRQLFVMATGVGKTHTFSQLPQVFKPYLPGQMLVLAHREELIDQAIKKIRKENPTLRIDKEKAEWIADPTLADVVVASVASMTDKRTKRYNWANFDKFVIDEAHHSTADSYQNVLTAAGMQGDNKYDKRLLTGWTATPNRGDGAALATVYKRISYSYSLRDAIGDGWLVDVRGYRVQTDTSLDGVKITAGEYNQKSLAATVNTPSRNLQAYNAWKELADGQCTIGFCVDIQHAQDMAELFNAKGVKAEAVWGDDPERGDTLGWLADGTIDILFNCGLLTEGFDCWQVVCALMCAPYKSPVRYAQCAGRTTRLQDLGYDYNLNEYRAEHLEHPLADLGIKDHAIIIDMVDNSSRNSLVTLPTLMGLLSTMDLRGESLFEAVKKIEEKQKEYPHLDLSKLPDVSKLNTYIEAINLFDVVYKPEVEANSEMSWHPSATGGYVLMLPDREVVKIEQDLLDKYVMTAVLNGQKYKGSRDSLEEAFSAADGLILTKRPDAVRVVKRDQAWHEEPPTLKQLSTIKKFYKGKQIPANLTKGMASRLISQALAGRAA